MSDASVLKRKLAPPLVKALAECAVETLLRKTMPRDADKLFSLDLVVDDVSFSEANKDRVIQGLVASDLVNRLSDGSRAGGLCILSADLLAGLIEIQLYGYVTNAAPPERKPTRTDGIVAATLVDAWLSSAQSGAEDDGMEPLPFDGFSRCDGVLDQRNAALLIEPGTYSLMTVNMTLGDAGKSGKLTLAWPKKTQPDAPDANLSIRMQKHLVRMEVPLKVVLTRLPLPIEKVRALAIGDVINVPSEALLSVKLEGVDGTPVGTGRLGQLNDMRAVRLVSDRAVQQPVALAAPEDTPQGAPPNMQELTSLPELATSPRDIQQMSAAEATPVDLPELPDFPDGLDLPDLPALPDTSDGDQSPELPDLPDLPELP